MKPIAVTAVANSLCMTLPPFECNHNAWDMGGTGIGRKRGVGSHGTSGDTRENSPAMRQRNSAMASKSDEIVQQVQHDFQTLWADITGSEGTGVVYLRR